MERSRLFLGVLALTLLTPALGRSQFGGGKDPNERWNQWTGGRDVWVRSQISDPNQVQQFDRIAQRLGNPTGQITRQQYLEYAQQRLMMRGQQGGSGGRGGHDPDSFADNLFRRLDRNGDGLLNSDEMPDTLRGERAKWDQNQDGFIDLAEFRAYAVARIQQLQQDRSQVAGPAAPAAPLPDPKPTVYRAGHLPKGMPDWFTELDTDADGQISLYEWHSHGRPIGEFLEMDRNNDGFLVIDEVLRATARSTAKNGSDANPRATLSASAPGDAGFGSGPRRDGKGDKGNRDDRRKWSRQPRPDR